MPLNEAFIAEIENEAKATRRLLERVPLDKSDWKPHEKSMTLGRLASHVAEIPGWVAVSLDQDELDFAKMDYKPKIAKTNAELLEIFEENHKKAIDALKRANDAEFMKPWTLRNGEQVYMTLPKAAVVRSFAISHQIHHRGQLSVYMRLNDVALPGIYGPTADEPM